MEMIDEIIVAEERDAARRRQHWETITPWFVSVALMAVIGSIAYQVGYQEGFLRGSSVTNERWQNATAGGQVQYFERGEN